MKLGLSEILIILAVIGVVLLVFRGNSESRTAPPPAVTRARRPTTAEGEEERLRRSRRNRFRVLGGAFVLVGVVILLSSFKMLDVLFMSYTWAGLIIIGGILVLFLAGRNKQQP